MAGTKLSMFLSLCLTVALAASVIQGSRLQVVHVCQQSSDLPGRKNELNFRVGDEGSTMSSRRRLIGSTAPTCTYNECRMCKYKCRAEQVPVEGNDPMNSPYRYRCVCHR